MLVGVWERKLLSRTLPNIVITLFILFTIIFLKLNVHQIVVLVFFFQLGRESRHYRETKEFRIKQLLKSVIIMCVLIYSLYYGSVLFGVKYAVLFFVLTVLLFSGFRIYQNRVLFMEGMRRIETQLFGKPLDKENWKKGELRK